MNDQVCLWEILINNTFSMKYHLDWDSKVTSYVGGVSICHVIKGKWQSLTRGLLTEPMIVVRIAATERQMQEIAKITLDTYHSEECVMYYLISPMVHIKHREIPDV